MKDDCFSMLSSRLGRKTHADIQKQFCSQSPAGFSITYSNCSSHQTLDNSFSSGLYLGDTGRTRPFASCSCTCGPQTHRWNAQQMYLLTAPQTSDSHRQDTWKGFPGMSPNHWDSPTKRAPTCHFTKKHIIVY